ncbi:hypothetical protein [Saccharothrix sp. HUAS TT1]|uniref:hypothetical protein n=1 Tax=unclassified Saccharothrix TaxID=2593673 RepID=UPI00345B8E20
MERYSVIIPAVREIAAADADRALDQACLALRAQGWTGINEGAEMFDVTTGGTDAHGRRRYAVIIAALRDVHADGPPDVDIARAELTGLGWTPLPDGHEVHDHSPTGRDPVDDDQAGAGDVD